MVHRLEHHDGMSKNSWKNLRYGWRRMERVKCTDKIKNAVVLERVGEGRIVLELIKKRGKIGWATG